MSGLRDVGVNPFLATLEQLEQLKCAAGYLYFKNLRHTGWRSLAGVFLAFTGAEATFAGVCPSLMQKS